MVVHSLNSEKIHHIFHELMMTYRMAHSRARSTGTRSSMSTLRTGTAGTSISVCRYATNHSGGLASSDTSTKWRSGGECSDSADGRDGGESGGGELDHGCFVD